MAELAQVEAQVQKDEEVVDVPIFQKNGDPYLGSDGKQSTVGVLGSESRRYVAQRDKLTQRLIRRQQTKTTPKDLRDQRIEQAASVVIRWSGWEADGKPWSCDPENVRALLKHDHILEQVETGIHQHSDFFGAPSRN